MAGRGCRAKAHAYDGPVRLHCDRANRCYRLSSPDFIVPRPERHLGRTELGGFVRIGREAYGCFAWHDACRMVADRRVRATLEIFCHGVPTLRHDATVD